MGSKQRALEAETLLLGLLSRNADSPVALAGHWLVKEIMEIRSEPVLEENYGTRTWSDPDHLHILHRRNDLPAVEIFTNISTSPWQELYKAGTKKWYVDGLLHRDGDKPAIETPSGAKLWYKKGQLHRDGDLPAMVLADGTQEWHVDGLLHRDGDLPAMVLADGTQEWHVDGLLHREGDNPAIVEKHGNIRMWYKKGLKHRDATLGPAVLHPMGPPQHPCAEWWENGKCISTSP